MYKKQKFNKRFVKKENEEVRKEDTTPVHLKNVVYLVKNNAEIRHYTSLAMIKLLKNKDENLKDKKIFIKFLDKKYAICYDGLNFEYRYNNEVFVAALAASFPIFAHVATKTINNFIIEEQVNIKDINVDELTNETIDSITQSEE